MKYPAEITAVWLHAVFNERGEATDKMRVCVEMNGEWREIIVEAPIGHCSHICESRAFSYAAIVDVPGGTVLKPASGGVQHGH